MSSSHRYHPPSTHEGSRNKSRAPSPNPDAMALSKGIPRPRAVRFLLAPLVLTMVLLSALWLLPEPTTTSYETIQPISSWRLPSFGTTTNKHKLHPIDRLISDAQRAHASLLSQRSSTLREAAAAYRARRGRHPPPGFDAWWAYAAKHDAVVVEAFFDRVEKDMGPFWGIEPRAIAERAAAMEPALVVRRGGSEENNSNVSMRGDGGFGNTWRDLLSEVGAASLPEVDMPVNVFDESRVFASWETVDELMGIARKQGRRLVPKENVVRNYTGLAEVDALRVDKYEPKWITEGSAWELQAVRSCPPSSPSKHVPAAHNLTGPPPLFPKGWNANYTLGGYVVNFTAAMDPCGQPHLREMHGSMFRPATLSCTTELLPMFAGSKLPMSNDIVIPGGALLLGSEVYTPGSHGPRWENKTDGIIWRGLPTGGNVQEDNWTRFQRVRLVEMLNGTTVAAMEEQELAGGESPANSFRLPPPSGSGYDLPRRRSGSLGTWLQSFADAGFGYNAMYSEPILAHMRTVGGVPMAEQFQRKYIPDADGNGYSARFQALVASSSVPIKGTVYAEWHNDRLTPWVHFAPMDNTFQDLYAILEYFTRDEKGDRAARRIAEGGQEWAARVLRREDMLLYLWRVVLEFARVCDPQRERMGFVDDL